MKTLFFLSLLIICSVTFSCKKETIYQNNPTSNPAAHETDGSWNMVLASGGLMGITEVYSEGTIVWTFNAEDSTLVVEDNSTTVPNYSYQAGTYAFYESEVDGEVYMYVNGAQIGVRSLLNDTLELGANTIVMDGFMFKFVR